MSLASLPLSHSHPPPTYLTVSHTLSAPPMCLRVCVSVSISLSPSLSLSSDAVTIRGSVPGASSRVFASVSVS
jgi:hypothetical protein